MGRQLIPCGDMVNAQFVQSAENTLFALTAYDPATRRYLGLGHRHGELIGQCPEFAAAVEQMDGSSLRLVSRIRGHTLGPIDRQNECGVSGVARHPRWMSEPLETGKARPGPAYVLTNSAPVEQWDRLAELVMAPVPPFRTIPVTITGLSLRGYADHDFLLEGRLMPGMSGSPILQDGKLVGALMGETRKNGTLYRTGLDIERMAARLLETGIQSGQKGRQKGDQTMSNSSLVTVTLLSPNYTKGRTYLGKTWPIDTITVHCVVGQLTAKQICQLFQSSDRNASCNYAVGKDGSIGLCVDEGNRSWCTGGTLSVNGESGKINDYHAVTIEVASDTTDPYAVTDAAYEALVRLVADIAKRNGLGTLKWQADKSLVGKPEAQNMTAHRWFANKACPGDYLYERMGDIAQRANKINEEEIDMTKEEVQTMIQETVDPMIQAVSEQIVQAAREVRDELTGPVYDTVAECPEWARKAVQWAVDSGYIQGNENGLLQLTGSKLWGLQVMYNVLAKGA